MRDRLERALQDDDDMHSGHPGMVQRLRLIAMLIISVNTMNHRANVANNKGDIS